MLLHSMDVMLNVTNMFIFGGSIKCDAHGGKIGPEGLKFAIHEKMLDFHTAGLTQGVDSGE